MPRAALVKILDRPGALEREIGIWIAEKAKLRASHLFAASEPPPSGADLWSRAVRGVYQRMVAERDAAEAAERTRQYIETDDMLRRMKAEQDAQ